MSQAARVATAVGVVLGAGSLACGADELSDLRAAVQMLQERVAQLEQAQAQIQVPAQAPVQAQTQTQAPLLPVRLPRGFAWKGDMRLRNETTREAYGGGSRTRDRIRVRTGFEARVNDTLRTELVLSTGDNGDPRGANATFTNVSSRKPLMLNTAYVEWTPSSRWKLAAGKMPQSWLHAGLSTFFGGEINHEGVAATYTRGDVSATAFYNIINEWDTGADSVMMGGQLAWRPWVSAGDLVLATGYFGFGGVQGRRPFYGGRANGNSLNEAAGSCVGGETPCLAQAFGLVEAMAQYSVPVGGRPLLAWVDTMYNTRATTGEDAAWSVGLKWGDASEPRTWELGYFYQWMERDALFGQYVDGAFAGGSTDVRGSAFKAGYAPARNWVINGTYYLNETNLTVPALVEGVGPVLGRGFSRLQLDVSFRY